MTRLSFSKSIFAQGEVLTRDELKNVLGGTRAVGACDQEASDAGVCFNCCISGGSSDPNENHIINTICAKNCGL